MFTACSPESAADPIRAIVKLALGNIEYDDTPQAALDSTIAAPIIPESDEIAAIEAEFDCMAEQANTDDVYAIHHAMELTVKSPLH